MKVYELKKSLIIALGLIGYTSITQAAGRCISGEFINDYCYVQIPYDLSDNSIAVEPQQYEYVASTLFELKKREDVTYIVSCPDGSHTEFQQSRVSREEKRFISEARRQPELAIRDLKAQYARYRAQLNFYFCQD